MTEPTFVVPQNLAEALEELGDEDTLVIGGGTSIALLVKNRLVFPEKLVYVRNVPGLSGITADGELRIGAMTTVRELTRSTVVAQHAPVLAEAASHVGNPRVRALATVGGALVHGDPRQDLPPVFLALGASAVLQSRSGTRVVPASEFFLGFMESACREDELVTAVTIPLKARRRAHYVRYTPGSEDDYPTVGVASVIVFGADGTVEQARVALGGVATRALLVPGAASLIGTRAAASDIDAVADAAQAACDPTDDQRGSADYKRDMVRVMTRRAIAACVSPQ